MTYQGTREGAGRTLVYDFPTLSRALQWVGQTILDNGHGSKRNAQEFAATIELDVPATHGPYTFTIVKR